MAKASKDSTNVSQVIQLLKQNLTEGINISPYLLAIQNLKGQTPGEKYKELKRIANIIAASHGPGKCNFLRDDLFEDVAIALKPLVRIRVGNILKCNEAVIEGLKSEDISVINQAFKAKWFFHWTNPIVTADYFLANILPYISEFVRFRIIKSLSLGLIGEEKKADEFFDTFKKLYGIKEVMPLLPTCSEIFIDKIVQRHKLNLDYKTLGKLYKRHPNLVIRYLKCGVENKNCKNAKQSLSIISRHNFNRFLPRLIRHHVHEFAELHDGKYYRQLGSLHAKLFLKNGLQIFIEKPQRFIQIIPIRMINQVLTLQQFETMYANLFPQRVSDFSLYTMADRLKYYPKEKREDLIKSLFKLKYSVDLMDFQFKYPHHNDFFHRDIFDSLHFRLVHDTISPNLYDELFAKYALPSHYHRSYFNQYKYSKEKRNNLMNKVCQRLYGSNYLELFNDPEFFPLYNCPYDKKVALQYLELSDRKKIVSGIVAKCEEKSRNYYEWYVYMPPKDSFPVFIDAITTSSDEEDKIMYLTLMVESAAIDIDKNDYLTFLQYYKNQHKNENSLVLKKIFKSIRNDWNLKCFDKLHFTEILEILEMAHENNELKNMSSSKIYQIYRAMIDFFVLERLKNNKFSNEMNNLFNKMLRILVDHNLGCGWSNISSDFSEWYDEGVSLSYPDRIARQKIRKDFFDKALKLIELKYDVKDVKWQQKNLEEKCVIIECISGDIRNFNYNLIKKKITKICLSDYPIFMEMLKEVLSSDCDVHKKRHLLREAKQIEPNLDSLLGDISNYISAYDIINNSYTNIGETVIELKRNGIDIFKYLDGYLKKCRKYLSFIKTPETQYHRRQKRAVKRFILCLKWYNDAPAKILENCLESIEEKGSLKILGIMLEGEVFSKLVTPLLPKDASTDINSNDVNHDLVKSSIAAMKYTSPPVPITTLILFTTDEYFKLVVPTVAHILKRVSGDKTETVVEHLIDKLPSVKRRGIRFCLQLTLERKREELVQKMWLKYTDPSIREIIAIEVHKRLAKSPNDANWRLVKICIEGLTAGDDLPVNVFCNVTPIKSKFLNRCIVVFIDKIEELAAKEEDLKFSKITAIKSIIESISPEALPHLTKNVITKIIDGYGFMEPSETTISLLTAAEKFAKKIFFRRQPFSSKYVKFSYD